MRTPSPRDHDGEVFTGPTVQHALAAARAAHGPAVQVVRAVRRTSGLRGLLGSTRVELVVRPPAPRVTVRQEGNEPAARSRNRGRTDGAAPGVGDPVGGALEGLLEAVEERERESTEELVDDTAWTWAQQQEVARLLEELTTRSGTAGQPPPGKHPAPALAEHDDLPEDGSDAPGSGWDRDELRRLGVPPAVLSHLPVEDPSDDAGWRHALRQAIGAAVPAPGRPGEQTPVVVSGHGLLGAIAVLRAGAEEGATPGTISFAGKRRAATPAALVEVLSSCARS